MVALLHATWSLDQLVRQGQRALFETVRATQSSQQLADAIIDLERSARQYVIVGDASLMDVYNEKRTAYNAVAERLAGLNLEPLQRKRLVTLRAEEEQVDATLQQNPHDSTESADVVEKYDELSLIAKEMLMDNRRLVEREVEELEANGSRAQHVLFLQAAALMPAVMLLATFFAVLVARAIRRLDTAIRVLGDGNFTKPVQIVGPRDLEQLGERLDWMRTRLKEAEQEKTRFLRHISHELKTPLAAVRESAELLREEVVGVLNSQQREIASILRDNSLRLQKLIEDLLDFNVASSRASVLRLTTVNLRTLLDTVLSNYKIAAMARQLRVRTQLEDVQMTGDKEKLKTLIDNLVSNAIKYSPESGRLHVRLKTRGDEAIIEVADSGPGIPQDEREKVFDAFYQCASTPISHVQGTGLGLSIAREYAHAHGGRIEVVDGPEGGACLRVTLPLKNQEAEVA
jgi:two-component system sensor histidine kinase GlrK